MRWDGAACLGLRIESRWRYPKRDIACLPRSTARFLSRHIPDIGCARSPCFPLSSLNSLMMPGAQIFITALAFATTACSAVYASPTHPKRQSYQAQTSIACTGWTGPDKDHSAIEVWHARDNAIEMWKSVNGGLGNNDGWQVAPSNETLRPQNNAYQIANNAVISAASVYIPETNTVEKQVFFVSTDNTLRSFYFNGTAWGDGAINAGMPTFARGLSASAFRLNGVTTWSVIYAEGEGYTPTLKEFRSVGHNAWRWAGNIATTAGNAAFTTSVLVDGNTVNERIFMANGDQYYTRWTWSPDWNGAPSQWTTIQGGALNGEDRFNGANIAAVNLGNEGGRIFTTSYYNSDLKKWSFDQHQTVDRKVTSFGNDKHISVQNQSPLCAAAQVVNGKQYIYVFHRNTNGKIAYALYNGSKWDGQVSSIDM
ncbi:hypothetical protein FRB93_010997 [Tulasnella sp. JGI-2019a]|nr:hypothetical protein FRB93_010997 [Tulasnella sp. JGI-2019a]